MRLGGMSRMDTITWVYPKDELGQLGRWCPPERLLVLMQKLINSEDLRIVLYSQMQQHARY